MPRLFHQALGSLLLGLSGCAVYRPIPLPTVEALLQHSPVVSVQASPAHALLPARSIDLKAPLTDLDAARLALVASPELKAMRARVGVSQAQLFSAGLVSDPQISLSIDRPDIAGLVNALGAGLSFDLATLFTRADRVASARSAVKQMRLDVAWTEWLALNQVRTLARRVVALERQISIAAEFTREAARNYERSERNMTLGDARLDDVAVYQIGYLDAQDRLLSLERQKIAARQDLNALVGIPPDAILTLSDDRPPRPLESLDAEALVLEAAHDRLDVRALAAGYAAQERGVRIATRNALPLPQLSINRLRDTSAIWTSGAGVAMSLPLWNRNRGEISIALATRAQLSAEYAARVLRIRADVVAQMEDLRAIEVQRAALARHVPELEKSAGVMAEATRDGNLPLLTYATVRVALLDKQLTLAALEQAKAEGEVALETALGKFLWEKP